MAAPWLTAVGKGFLSPETVAQAIFPVRSQRIRYDVQPSVEITICSTSIQHLFPEVATLQSWLFLCKALRQNTLQGLKICRLWKGFSGVVVTISRHV